MLRKITIGFGLLCLLLANAYTQEYSNAIGIRAGLPTGLTYKRFLDEHSAIEGIIGTRWRGVSLSALYEYHKETNLYPGLRWYFGGGAALGFYDNQSPWVVGNEYKAIFGIEAVIGIDYTFDEVPVNLGFDWTPLYNIIGYTDFDFLQFAISVRYVF